MQIILALQLRLPPMRTLRKSSFPAEGVPTVSNEEEEEEHDNDDDVSILLPPPPNNDVLPPPVPGMLIPLGNHINEANVRDAGVNESGYETDKETQGYNENHAGNEKEE